jgi:hypothetical protein
MELKDLRNYGEWIGKSPFEIRSAVSQYNGWTTVFASGLPRWAHRLRNYFNESPRELLRLDTTIAERLSRKAKKFELAVECARAMEHRRQVEMDKEFHRYCAISVPNNCPAGAENTPLPGFWDEVAHRHALSGDVYQDEKRRLWF